MMDETEGESRYLTNYVANQGFGSIQRPKVSVRNVPHPHSQQIADNYVDEDEEELEEDEEEQEVHGGDHDMNGVIQQNGDNDDDGDDDDGENHGRSDNFNLHRHPKKRKLKSLLSSFEFAPRLPAPPPQPPPPPHAAASTAKPSFGGRNTLTDWSEHETFVLLDAWGERFLQRGRKSIRSEEWQEVADKVSHESKTARTDTQCRNRLDTLKKKYKKEKSLLESSRNQITKWVYFKKMDMLMSSTIQPSGLSCGVDSGEYVFMNPTVYLNHANGLDEMRDSPGNTDSQEGDDDSDLLPLKRSKEKGDRDRINGGSFRVLADSINKFSEIYEKIENGKRKQMVELEKMRMDFHKELELQKRQILDRARDEIARIRQGDYEENDSAENISGAKCNEICLRGRLPNASLSSDEHGKDREPYPVTDMATIENLSNERESYMVSEGETLSLLTFIG